MVVHAGTKKQAEYLKYSIARRLKECGLEVNEGKTRIVFCRDGQRTGAHAHERFTFLGFEFGARGALNTEGGIVDKFLPAISPEAAKEIRETVRIWRLHRRSRHTLTLPTTSTPWYISVQASQATWNITFTWLSP